MLLVNELYLYSTFQCVLCALWLFLDFTTHCSFSWYFSHSESISVVHRLSPFRSILIVTATYQELPRRTAILELLWSCCLSITCLLFLSIFQWLTACKNIRPQNETFWAFSSISNNGRFFSMQKIILKYSSSTKKSEFELTLVMKHYLQHLILS